MREHLLLRLIYFDSKEGGLLVTGYFIFDFTQNFAVLIWIHLRILSLFPDTKYLLAKAVSGKITYKPFIFNFHKLCYKITPSICPDFVFLNSHFCLQKEKHC